MRKTKSDQYLFTLTLSAAMVALSVILCRFLGFSPENTPFRFEIGFLPISIVAYLFGPWQAALSYAIADMIGSLLSGYAPNVWITLCQVAFGAIMGILLHRKRTTVARTVICFSIIAVAIDFLLKSPIFVFMYGWTWEATFLSRLLNAVLNLPLRVVCYYILMKALEEPFSKMMKKFDKMDFKNYANSFQAVTVPGLSRIGELCRLLGNPERDMRFIHVAGTNGKGSTSANIASILEDAGYKVGKYISPNLIKVNERISINGIDISDDELSDILSRLEGLCAEVEKNIGESPTQFEIWTAAAFLYFKQQGCDYVVLEVGLGGEFDATNIIPTNEIAIITRLGIDHTQYLGNTIEEVAKAKAGIMKAGSATNTIVTLMQEDGAMKVIRDRAKELSLEVCVCEPIPTETDGIYEKFDLGELKGLKTGISGYHQIENASLAVMAAVKLGIDEKYIRSGIARAKNPARFELIRENPTVIYDGGHNENGIEALCASIERYFGNVKKTVIFACMKDKEIKESLRMLSQGETEFIFTAVKDNPRALSALGLKERAAELGYSGEAYESIKDAYDAAIGKGELVIICGSLYLYKDFREFYKD